MPAAYRRRTPNGGLQSPVVEMAADHPVAATLRWTNAFWRVRVFTHERGRGVQLELAYSRPTGEARVHERHGATNWRRCERPRNLSTEAWATSIFAVVSYARDSSG